MDNAYELHSIKLLNHGFIRLIEAMGSDLSISRNARCSYDAAWRAGEDEGSDYRLLNYLVKHQHTSPLECVQMTFEVKAPIFVFRQWHRHRTWAFNELSARYRELSEEYYIPEISQLTTQSTSNKQMRTDIIHPKADELQQMITDQCAASFITYHKMLKLGAPRELARGVLPVNTYSHMFATVDLLNLMKFCKLRLHEHAQYEIRVYAQAMFDVAKSICPITVAAVEKHWLT